MGFKYYSDGRKSKVYYTKKLHPATVIVMGLIHSLKGSIKDFERRENRRKQEEAKLKVKFDETDYKFNLNVIDTELHKIDSDVFNTEFAKHRRHEEIKERISLGIWTTIMFTVMFVVFILPLGLLFLGLLLF